MKVARSPGTTYFGLLIATLSILICPASFAQETSPKTPLLNYGFRLLPDTRGTLNAMGNIGLNWTPWLSSELAAFTDNYTMPFESTADVSTVVSSGRALALTAIRIDEDLLWVMLKNKLDFLEFSAGIIGAYDWTEQNQYGYDPSLAVPLFYQDKSVKTVLRPLQSYSLGLRLGPVLVSGKFESTIYWSAETILSSRVTSAMSAAPDPTSIEYQGGETLVGGNLELDLRIVKLLGGADYYRHIMTDGTKANTSMSDTWTYRGALLLSFLKLAGGSPLVGASLVNRSDYFVARDQNIDTSTIRLEIGLRY